MVAPDELARLASLGLLPTKRLRMESGHCLPNTGACVRSRPGDDRLQHHQHWSRLAGTPGEQSIGKYGRPMLDLEPRAENFAVFTSRP